MKISIAILLIIAMVSAKAQVTKTDPSEAKQLFRDQIQQFLPYPERHRRFVQSIGFSPDGNTLYFTLPHREYLEAQGIEIDENTPRLAIYTAQKTQKGWSNPTLVPFAGRYKEYEPTLSPDGKIMLFNSDRPKSGTDPVELNNLWYSRMKNGVWQEPQHLPGIYAESKEVSYATITKKNDLYFVTEREIEGKKRYSVFYTKFKGEKTPPEQKILELPFGIGDPWVAPDGRYLICTKFDNDRWRETCDLYYSIRKDKKWTEPKELPFLNGEGADFAVAISPDEKWLYYRRERKIWKVPFVPILEKMMENK